MEKIQNQELTNEEIAKIEKTRAISDADLLKGGAEYEIDDNGDKKLIPTNEQIEAARLEMNSDLDSKKTLTDKIRAAIGENDKEKLDGLFKKFKELYEPELRRSLKAFNFAVFDKLARRYELNFLEDSIQETFLEAYKNMSKLNEDKNIVGWLNTVGQNKFRDYARLARRRDAMESEQQLAQLSLENDVTTSEPGPSESLSHEELLVAVRDAIYHMPSDILKETAKLMYIEGLNRETIMKQQNISLENYNKRAQRIRTEVKEQLDLMGIDESNIFPLNN